MMGRPMYIDAAATIPTKTPTKDFVILPRPVFCVSA